MDGEPTGARAATAPQAAGEPADAGRSGRGLHHPKAIDILTTEHWSLLSHRTLDQEMFGRTTLFVAVLSGTVVALALLGQANRFGRETLWFALFLLSVALFIGVVTFLRCVAINYEDARWVAGMGLLHDAYLRLVPELEPFFLTARGQSGDRQALGHGSPQRLDHLAMSLTTTSGVAAALDSVLAGTLSSDIAALLGAGPGGAVAAGVGLSLASAALHVRYAARFRRRHSPAAPAPGPDAGREPTRERHAGP